MCPASSNQDYSCGTRPGKQAGVGASELGIRAQKKQRSGTSLALITFFSLFLKIKPDSVLKIKT